MCKRVFSPITSFIPKQAIKNSAYSAYTEKGGEELDEDWNEAITLITLYRFYYILAVPYTFSYNKGIGRKGKSNESSTIESETNHRYRSYCIDDHCVVSILLDILSIQSIVLLLRICSTTHFATNLWEFQGHSTK